MPPRKQDFQAYLETTQQRQTTSEVEQLIRRSAGVMSEKLTGLPEWDAYLRHLQGALDEATSARDQWKDECLETTNTEAMREAQVQYHSWKSRVDALKWAMELPSTLIKEYHESRSSDRLN